MPAARSESSESDIASKSKSKAIKGDPESEDEAGSDADEGTEYEIEEVLDAKRGYFPDGRMGYFVKWKGYGPGDNSWVDEQDAGNAKELVDEFWRKNPQKKKAIRKSMDKKPPKKARASVPTDDASEADDISTTKKRGRKSTSQKPDSDNDMDVDELQEKPSKKAKTNSTQPAKTKPKVRQASPEEEIEVGTMKDYMHVKNWEGLVKTVDTVEQEKLTNKLVVFFTLNSGEKVRENSSICKERFPQKMLDFYESNLRWREAQDVDSD